LSFVDVALAFVGKGGPNPGCNSTSQFEGDVSKVLARLGALEGGSLSGEEMLEELD
jgi:hypothetical protein